MIVGGAIMAGSTSPPGSWTRSRCTSFRAVRQWDRMFEDMGVGHVWLEPVEVVDRPLATHVRYRVVK